MSNCTTVRFVQLTASSGSTCESCSYSQTVVSSLPLWLANLIIAADRSADITFSGGKADRRFPFSAPIKKFSCSRLGYNKEADFATCGTFRTTHSSQNASKAIYWLSWGKLFHARKRDLAGSIFQGRKHGLICIMWLACVYVPCYEKARLQLGNERKVRYRKT